MSVDYAKRLDSLADEAEDMQLCDSLPLDEAIDIARALLKERDEIAKALDETIAIDYGRLTNAD
jgi:hypothetical protein